MFGHSLTVVTDVVLEKTATVTEPITQDELEEFARLHPDITELQIHLGYDDDVMASTGLKFTMPFPNLKVLSLGSCPVDFSFTKEWTPNLELITCDSLNIDRFHLDLPQLRSLSFNFVNLQDDSGFGPSLSRSPLLEDVFGYKFWGLGGGIHTLLLPKCIRFQLTRSDDLVGLHIYAPKLQELNLRSAYALEFLKFLETCKEYKKKATSLLSVNVINCVDYQGKVRTMLKSHPRVQWIYWKSGYNGGLSDGRALWTGDPSDDL